MLHLVKEHDSTSCVRKTAPDFSLVKKCMAALRCLLYGDPLDTQGGYVRMPMFTAFESVYMVCQAVVVVYGPIYLRA
jgi:hypothetical protein